MTGALRGKTRGFAPAFVLVGVSLLFRVPALLNAAGTNSDAAVVGLQAMHVLRGEHAVRLWGSAYQTSVDSYVAAAFFAVLGATPIGLMLSALSLHMALTGLAYALVHRAVRHGWLALALVGPLVLAPASVHAYALYPPRQAALTLAFASLYACERAYGAHRPRAWSAAGGVLALLAVYADPYAALLVPAAALLVVFGTGRARRAVAFAAGALAGAIPVALRMTDPAAKQGVFSMTTDVVAHNLKLLLEPCGPWAIGTTAFAPERMMDWTAWSAPWPVRVVQVWGGVAFFVVAGASAALVFAHGTGARARRLGAVGLCVALATVAAFLVSRMVMDHFSMRYLVAVVLAMPLLATPLAERLGARRFVALFAPWVATTAICGWIGFTPFVRGPWPVRHPAGTGTQEDTLARELYASGVTYAVADYWAAYRVTFDTRERLVVVPLHESQDRYGPYRDALRKADRFAYVYDPLRSSEDERSTVREWQSDPHVVVEDRIDTGAFRALVVQRR